MTCYVVSQTVNVMNAQDGRPLSISAPSSGRNPSAGRTPSTGRTPSAGNASSARRAHLPGASTNLQNRVVAVKLVTTKIDLISALAVRRRVCVEEMRIPRNHEFDAFDGWPIPDGIKHFLVSVDRTPVATCRVNTIFGNGAKLERLAVEKYARLHGVGRELIAYIERTPLVSNLTGAFSASVLQEQVPFYRKVGLTSEEGHTKSTRGGFGQIQMIKRRRPKGAASELSLSHVMVKTLDINRARQFYSLMSFTDVRRFKTSGVRAAWLESPFIDQNIELMEIKTLISENDPSLQKLASLSDFTPGLGHISIDLSRACTDLTKFLMTMQAESVSRFQMGLRILSKPQQKMLGRLIVEVAFITDADGTILELMRIINKLERKDLDSEW